jgi:hypothetical protein
MPKKNGLPAALKHGAYSQSGLLPGEDAAAFEKLHAGLLADFLPQGAVEENIVADLARLYWRKQNLATYRRAERARRRHSAIKDETGPDDLELRLSRPRKYPVMNLPVEIGPRYEAANQQAREELGDDWELIEMGNLATVEYLLQELSVADRLDGMIDRALKRLLFVRGIKSYGAGSSAGPNPPSIEGPKAA